jgi:cytidylate kinase
VLSRLDERAVSHFDELVSNILLPVEQAQLAFLHEMTKVIWALAREGHAILVGRGANWLLDARFGLRVRIVAPPEHRAERIMRERGLSLPEAQRLIRDDDARRASFIRQAYGKDIADPLGYDLVLNTAALDTDTAAGIVLSVLHQKVGVTT